MKAAIPVIAVGAALLYGCATPPDKVKAIAAPIGAYADKGCAQLAEDKMSNDDLINFLSKRQQQAANGDALGVFLVGIPTASLTGGDVEPDLAAAKGNRDAIESEMQKKGCVVQ